jgi:hypothetical protein
VPGCGGRLGCSAAAAPVGFVWTRPYGAALFRHPGWGWWRLDSFRLVLVALFYIQGILSSINTKNMLSADAFQQKTHAEGIDHQACVTGICNMAPLPF